MGAMKAPTKKKIFIIGGLFLLACLIALIYVNVVLLPVKAKNFLVKKSEEFLHRKISIGEIQFIPVKGIVIRNIIISEKDDPTKIFLTLDELNCNVLITAILRNKQIIIPTFRVAHPTITVSRNADNSWNFSDLLEQKQNTSEDPAHKNPYQLWVRKIILEGATINFTDRSLPEEFNETITDLNASAEISLDTNISYDLSFKTQKSQSSGKLNGTFALKDKSVLAKATLENIPLAQYLKLVKTSLPVDLTSGKLSKADLTIEYKNSDISVSGNVGLVDLKITKEALLDIAGNLNAENISLSLKNNVLEGKGTIKSDTLKITSNGRTVDTDIALQVDSLRYENQNLTLGASLSSIKTLITIDPQRSIQTDLTAPNLLLTYSSGIATLKGNISTQNSHIMIDQTLDLISAINFKNLSFTKKDQNILLEGNIDLTSASIKSGSDKTFTGTIAASEISLSHDGTNLNFKSKLAAHNATITLGADKKITADFTSENAHLSLTDKTLHFDGLQTLKKALVEIGADMKFRGDYDVNLAYDLDLESKQSTYKGTLGISEALFSGLPQINELKIAVGEVAFDQNSLSANNLTLNTQNTNLTITGTVKDFENPSADLHITTSDVNLALIKAFASRALLKANIDVSGHAALDCYLKGPISSPVDSIVNLKATLTDTNLSLQSIHQTIQNIAGIVNYEASKLSWQDLKGTFQGENYTLNGQLNDFKSPLISTTVESANISASTQLQVLNQKIKITSLSGKYYKSSFDIKGDVLLAENADPSLDVNSSFNINLADLRSIAPQFKDTLASAEPKGQLAVEGFLKGPLNNWPEWQLSMRIKSDYISIFQTPIQNLSIQYSQRDKKITENNILANIYNGNIVISSTSDLTTEGFPAKIDIRLDNMKLEDLAKDRKLEYKNLSGNVAAVIKAEAPLLNIKSITGQGSFAITDANLGEFKLIEEIAKFATIKEIHSIIFNGAQGTFLIANEKIQSQKTEIFGNTVNIRVKGWLDFNKNLDIEANPDVSEIVMNQSDSLKRIPTGLIGQALVVKITGTIDHPKVTSTFSPLKPIENVKDLLQEGVKGILENIF